MSNPPLDLDPIARGSRLSDVVSERLLAAIRAARLPPGAKLPSERELGQQFGVSRTVIREAVRDLTAKGVLDVSSGVGASVAKLDSTRVSDALALFLMRHGALDPDKVHEVRHTIELATVRLAAERADKTDLAVIREAHENMVTAGPRPDDAAAADVAFHRAIVLATGNELFLILIDSISDVMMQTRLATLGKLGRVRATVRQHKRVLDALEAHDSDGAAEAMGAHLEDSYKAFRSATSA